MRRITPATVTVGVLFAFVGLVGAYVVKDAMKPRTVPPDIVNNVMVAIADFPADHVLTVNDVGRLNMPREQIPEGAIMDRQALVGRRLKQDVKAFTPFTGNLFYPMGGGPTLGDKLKPGFRAVTIEATPVTGVDGLIRPGDVVDILLSIEPDRANGQVKGGSTTTLLQGIEVLAVDKSLDRTVAVPNQSGGQTVTVTVSVTPDDANALVLAKDNGRLQLVLRNPEEEPSTSLPKRWTREELLNIEQPAEPTQEAPPKRFYAEVYRGTQRDELEFETEKQPPRRIPGAGSQGSPPGRVRSGNLQRTQSTPQSAPAPSNGSPAQPGTRGSRTAPTPGARSD